MSAGGNKGLVWPYSQSGKAQAPAPSGTGVWQRSDGSKVNMAEMNPHHRAAAIKKAERDGNNGLADQLRASGPLPE